MHLGRGTWIARLQQAVGGLGAAPVVETLPARPRVGWHVRRQAHVGQGRLEPQAGATDDDGGSTGCDDLVDRVVRQRLELTDGALAVERPDADQARVGVLVREDREPAVDLHRVGRNELGRDSLGNRLGDGGLARRGRAENGEDGGWRGDGFASLARELQARLGRRERTYRLYVRD